MYVFRKHRRTRKRERASRRDCEEKEEEGHAGVEEEKKREWSHEKKTKQQPQMIYPFTFCPPGELNDPLGVPFDCRQPF